MLKPLTFTRKLPVTKPIDLSILRPDALVGKEIKEIERLRLGNDRQSLAVGDIFKISGNNSAHIKIEDSVSAFERIGYGMTEGSIAVFGDAGAFTGALMRGGEIHISGSAGDFSASSMSGGLVRIEGSAGNYLGAGAPGSKFGMKDGCIVVNGDAGIRLGQRMRRGLIVAGGSVESGACAGMVAGTVIVLGKPNGQLGAHMRRGSILCTESPQFPPGTFFRQNLKSHGIVPLIERRLHASDIHLNLAERLSQPKSRFVGDLNFGGMGEVLVYGQ